MKDSEKRRLRNTGAYLMARTRHDDDAALKFAAWFVRETKGAPDGFVDFDVMHDRWIETTE